jgi:hypothetical protein
MENPTSGLELVRLVLWDGDSVGVFLAAARELG